jgi:hypothetical protein
MNFFIRFICAGQLECLAKNSSMRFFTSYCKLKRIGLTEKILPHFKRMLLSYCLIKKNNSKILLYPFLTPFPCNSELSIKKPMESTLKRNKNIIILPTTEMEHGKKITCLKGDSPKTKAIKMTMKRTTRMTIMSKMMNKMMMIIDKIYLLDFTLDYFLQE